MILQYSVTTTLQQSAGRTLLSWSVRLIRILLVDDNDWTRKALNHLLSREGDMTVVGESEDGLDAVRKAGFLKPHIVLMDLSMPGMDGIEATRQINASFPEIRVIMLTLYDSKQYISSTLKAGAMGYILKDSIASELVHGIREVTQGRMYLGSGINNTV